MIKRDFVRITIIGAEVGLFFQPIILALWPDIERIFSSTLGSIPSVLAVQIGTFLAFVLLAPTALFILSFLGKTIPVLYQFGKFAAVGISNTAVDIGLLNLTIVLSGISKGAAVFTTVATGTALVATVNSFLWNKYWTFDAATRKEKTLVELLKFYAVTGVAALVNGGITTFVSRQISHGGVSENLGANVGKVVGIISAMMINFLGYKFFVFKKQEGEMQERKL